MTVLHITSSNTAPSWCGNVFIFGLVARWARQPSPPAGEGRPTRILQVVRLTDNAINAGSSIFPESAIWRRRSIANGDSCPSQITAGDRRHQHVGIPSDVRKLGLGPWLVKISATVTYLGVHVAAVLYSRRRVLASRYYCLGGRSSLSHLGNFGLRVRAMEVFNDAIVNIMQGCLSVRY